MCKISILFIVISSNLSGQPHTNTLPLLIWKDEGENEMATQRPQIYYSPHQDDETLGMGASISRNVRKHIPVFVVLFANGKGSSAFEILNGNIECGLHKTIHTFNLSAKEFYEARNKEFISACKSLGVNRIYISNNGMAWDEAIGIDELTTRFEDLIVYFENQFPGATHNLISGNCDTTADSKQIAHEAGAVAIKNLFENKIVGNVNLYRVYVYYYPFELRNAQQISLVDSIDMEIRKKACDEYNIFDPKSGRYAIGFQHSVMPLFINSYSSLFEYIDFPKSDCK